MLSLSLLKQFSRLTIPVTNVRSIATAPILQFNVTSALCAEPMKKKKKVDPAIVKAREERRRKKIEKQIRRLEKNARQLKPIEELEVPLSLIDDVDKRRRAPVQLSATEVETRAILQKQWAHYKREEYMANVAQIDRMMAAQKRAMDELFQESQQLYNEAIQPDLQVIPYSISGPLVTPPIKNYDSPDGEYIDISKKWED